MTGHIIVIYIGEPLKGLNMSASPTLRVSNIFSCHLQTSHKNVLPVCFEYQVSALGDRGVNVILDRINAFPLGTDHRRDCCGCVDSILEWLAKL